MVNLSRIGSTNFTALGSSTGVKYARIMYTWAGKLISTVVNIIVAHTYTRKNFDRHFQESRHAFGMRALGLPNTKHFHEITRIEDALSRMFLYVSPTPNH